MGKKLLKEFMALCPDGMCSAALLTESEKQMKESGDLLLSGIIQSGNKLNGNGRIYPREVLEREMEVYQKAIKENRAVGELDHVDDEVVNLRNASHMIIRTWWDGDDVWGVIKVLKSTPPGSQLAGLIKDGVNIGISSRGLGSVRRSGGNLIVEDDFKLICWDIVSEASTPGAYLNLMEAKRKEQEIFRKSDRIYRSLNEIMRLRDE